MAQLSLSNIGKDTARYIISIMQIRMKEDGSTERITTADPGQQFADKYIRFYPRQVVLAPGKAQSIKVQLVNTGDMQTGEYRSHVYFRAEADVKPLGEDDSLKKNSSIAVDIVTVFGISVPVIIQVGEKDSKVNLTHSTFEMLKDTIPSLKLTFNRTGSMSVYGDITVDHISPRGKITRVVHARGLAIYTPNSTRRFVLFPDKSLGVDYLEGSLHVAYKTQPDARSLLLAESDIVLKK